jgi:hypothetical protein
MTPRPLYRWKSFWLGLFVVMSLGWAWWDSTRWVTSFHYGESSLRHAGSGICLAGRLTSSLPDWSREPISYAIWEEVRFDAPEIFRHSEKVDAYSYYYPIDPLTDTPAPRNAAAAHFDVAIYFSNGAEWAIYIPHWLLILLFFVPWTGFLAWRWRRMKCLAAGMAAEPAHGSI